MQKLEEAFEEVMHWRKIYSLYPWEMLVKKFVLELSRLFRAYADGSALESVAMKACLVMPLLLLQKPFRSSKDKDHIAILQRRDSWKSGDLPSLLSEGRALQLRLFVT